MARARILLKLGRAVVFRRYPFTIILKDRGHAPAAREHRIKIDPGSKTTGVAIVQEATGRVVAAVEIEHRGRAIKASLKARSGTPPGTPAAEDPIPQAAVRQPNAAEGLAAAVARKPDRQRADLGRPAPPALPHHRGVARAGQVRPPERAGSRDLRHRVPARHARRLRAAGVPLGEVRPHVRTIAARPTCHSRSSTSSPRAGAGPTASRISPWRAGRAIAARATGPSRTSSKRKPEVLAKVLKQAKAPLKDATAVNATRWELFRRLKATGLPIECGSGGRTKFNRTTQGLPKTHWLDAACVGASTPGAPGRRRRPTAAGQGVRPRQAEPVRDGQARIPDPPRAAAEV